MSKHTRLMQPIQITTATPGWVACYDCGGRIYEEPVVAWALVEIGWEDPNGDDEIERNAWGNQVVGLGAGPGGHLGLVEPMDPCDQHDDCRDFVGYMREGECPSQQAWWPTVLARREIKEKRKAAAEAARGTGGCGAMSTARTPE